MGLANIRVDNADGLGCSFLVPIRRVRSYNVKQKG